MALRGTCLSRLRLGRERTGRQRRENNLKSDAEGERDHGHRGEARVLQQLAEGEAKVVHGGIGAGSIDSFASVRRDVPDARTVRQ